MFSIDFLEKTLNEKKVGIGSQWCHNFTVNSSKINENDCFIGLIGEKTEGGTFFKEAILKGAVGLILLKKHFVEFLNIQNDFPNVWAFFVDDTKKSLQVLASAWRKNFDIPIIAITGSVGKTTTKELLKCILDKQGYKVFATSNSENGSIGLPLNILQLRSYHTIAIFELGIEKVGEMDVLCEILDHVDISIITTIVESHLKYFHSINFVIQEKIKLQNITKNLVCIDDDFKKYITKVPCISFSNKEKGDVWYNSLSTKVIIDFEDKKYNINTLYHVGFHHCLVAAFIISSFLKIKSSIIIQAIESFKKVSGRFSVHHLKSGGIIINDAYNAVNPMVMLKSIESFEEFPTYKKKIIVLADMFDLGSLQNIAHKMVIEKITCISSENIEKIFFVGENFFSFKEEYIYNNIIFKKSFQEIETIIFKFLDEKYCILFKGSNGTGLFKRIMHYLETEEI